MGAVMRTLSKDQYSRSALLVGAALSFFIALFQLILAFSVSLSRSFGAPPELLDKPLLLLFSGMVVSLVITGFGFYALSGAGRFRRLPYLHTVLLFIGIIFTLRGLAFFPELFSARAEAVISSFISLVTGIAYLIGFAFHHSST